MQGSSCWLLHPTFKVNVKCVTLVGLTPLQGALQPTHCRVGLAGALCEMSATVTSLHG